MKNDVIVLFFDTYNSYKKITDKVIFDKYLKSSYEKSFFYFPLILVVIGMITNIYYFNSLLFYGNSIVFGLLMILYMLKVEKILHTNISKIVIEYSEDIARNYSKFNRKYLRFLHFYHNKNSILSLNDIENIIEITNAKLENKNYSFLNSIIFTIIISLFISQLANTFGGYITTEAIINFIYFSSALFYIRYVLFGGFIPEKQKLAEFKEFLVDMKYLKLTRQRDCELSPLNP